jgi:glycine cleavage system H lipoate-binding protein/ABC-type phosphate transport system substrate-binding protein
MKTRIFLTIVLLLLTCCFAIGEEEKTGRTNSPEGSFTVNTSPDLFNLTSKWADEYQNLNPLVKIKVNKLPEANVPEIIGSESGIGIFSGKLNSALKNNSSWNMIVGRNVVVPVMNEKNPLFTEITTKGIPENDLIRIIREPQNVSWDKSNQVSGQNLMHVYFANDPFVLAVLSEFQNSDHVTTTGFQTLDDQKMIQAIQNDPNAIGFCKLAQIIDPETKDLRQGMKLIPIDRNGNGKLDYMEDIYSSLESLSRGVWIGKYPKAFLLNIYTVLPTPPFDIAEIDFLKWVVTDGQKYLGENGFSDLIYNEQIAQLARFDEPGTFASVPIESSNTIMSVLLLVLVVIVLGGVVVELAFVKFKRGKMLINDSVVSAMSAFDAESIIVPKGLYFDKTHSWAFMRKNGSVKVGIDDFLQHVTGKITRIETRNTGDIIMKGDRLLSLVHKGKQIHVYSPVSGTITEINENLVSNTSLINSDPYSEGWVYAIEPLNWGLELQYLMGADNFKAGLKDEFQRLKDFFATALKTASPAYAVLQDGGALTDNPLAELGPDVWDDFQTQFIDASK